MKTKELKAALKAAPSGYNTIIWTPSLIGGVRVASIYYILGKVPQEASLRGIAKRLSTLDEVRFAYLHRSESSRSNISSKIDPGLYLDCSNLKGFGQVMEILLWFSDKEVYSVGISAVWLVVFLLSKELGIKEPFSHQLQHDLARSYPKRYREIALSVRVQLRQMVALGLLKRSLVGAYWFHDTLRKRMDYLFPTDQVTIGAITSYPTKTKLLRSMR